MSSPCSFFFTYLYTLRMEDCNISSDLLGLYIADYPAESGLSSSVIACRKGSGGEWGQFGLVAE